MTVLNILLEKKCKPGYPVTGIPGFFFMEEKTHVNGDSRGGMEADRLRVHGVPVCGMKIHSN